MPDVSQMQGSLLRKCLIHLDEAGPLLPTPAPGGCFWGCDVGSSAIAPEGPETGQNRILR